jgi:hypothetical protein
MREFLEDINQTEKTDTESLVRDLGDLKVELEDKIMEHEQPNEVWNSKNNKADITFLEGLRGLRDEINGIEFWKAELWKETAEQLKQNRQKLQSLQTLYRAYIQTWDIKQAYALIADEWRGSENNKLEEKAKSLIQTLPWLAGIVRWAIGDEEVV